MVNSDVQLANTELIDRVQTEHGEYIRLEKVMDKTVPVTTVGRDTLSTGDLFFYSSARRSWKLVVDLDEWSRFKNMPPTGLDDVSEEGPCSFCGEWGRTHEYYFTKMHQECMAQFIEGCQKLIEDNSEHVVSKEI